MELNTDIPCQRLCCRAVTLIDTLSVVQVVLFFCSFIALFSVASTIMSQEQFAVPSNAHMHEHKPIYSNALSLQSNHITHMHDQLSRPFIHVLPSTMHLL